MAAVPIAKVHAADADDPPFQQRTWHKANPSLRFMPDLLARLKEEASQGASSDPAVLASFKALRLNMGVSDTVENVLLSADVWREIEVEDATSWQEVRAGSGPGPVGGDVGGISILAGHGRTGCLRCLSRATAPAGQGAGRRRGSSVRRMLEPGRADTGGPEGVRSIGELLEETLRRWGEPAAIVCDTWRLEPLREELAKSEYPRCSGCRQAHGILRRRQRCSGVQDRLSGWPRHPSKEPADAVGNESGARVVGDPAGNWKLSKGRPGEAAQGEGRCCGGIHSGSS